MPGASACLLMVYLQKEERVILSVYRSRTHSKTNFSRISRIEFYPNNEEIMAPHIPGSVEVICGSMFSGKTDELIRRLRRATIARQHVQVFKPSIDMRYAVEKVTSHAGQRF